MAATDLENQTQAQSGKSPNNAEASPSKKNDETPADQKAQAMMALSTGKRHMLCQDIPAAVESLGEACELMSVEFGEKAPECAEAYFYYGKALLEMARLESGVLGNALDGVPEEGDDANDSQVEDPEKVTEEERTEVEDKVGEAMEENFDECENAKILSKHSSKGKVTTNGDTNGVHDKDGESEKSEEDEEMEGAESQEEEGAAGEADADGLKEAEAEKSETDSVEGEKKEGEDAAAQEVEDEDDPSNLQLAWEMLELAKMVFTEQLEGEKKGSITPEVKTTVEKKLCETFLTLGEVSLENENYVQAVEDLSLCLDRQKASLPSDSRSIAETHYQLGVALGFHMKFEEAVVSLEAAIAVLDSRITNLKGKTESPDETKKDNIFHTREKEIAEIESLIPEIKEKITDTNEMKDESVRKVVEMKEQIGFGSSSSSGTGSSSSSSTVKPISAKPISSISIKRKAESDPTVVAVKKAAISTSKTGSDPVGSAIEKAKKSST
eukprot:GFUD01072076.1.p1 GENE.GFUD01072076.1~~GFUD01072076.1.p1  ORF type:complete len:514 (+),score=167.47 GFUD01072076.1:54-1544(+)